MGFLDKWKIKPAKSGLGLGTKMPRIIRWGGVAIVVIIIILAFIFN